MMPSRPFFRFGVFELDAVAGELRKGERRIRLQPQPLKLLVALLERPGEIVTREDLRQRLWSTETFVDFDQSLAFAVKQVRGALGDDADAPRYVETVPKRGYRFIAPLRADPRVPQLDQPLPPVFGPRRPKWPAAVIGGALLACALGAGWWLGFRTPTETPRRPFIRFEIAPAPAELFPADALPALSPDGRAIVFSAGPAGRHRLQLRKLGASGLHALAGTDGATSPFWSPDGRRIGFFAAGFLKTLDLANGTIATVCAVADARGASWNDADVLLVGQRSGPLLRVTANGGVAVPVTELDTAIDVAHMWPHFLPDGRHYLVTHRSLRSERTGVYLGELESTYRKPIVGAFGNAVVAGDFILYPREPFREHVPLFSAWRSVIVNRATLVAQRFDLRELRPLGEPVTLLEDVDYWAMRGMGIFSASAAGVLAFRAAEGIPHTALRWLDRTGTVVADFGEAAFYPHPEISPDGSKVAFNRLDLERGTADIWIADLVHDVRTRLTFDPALDTLPVWSPDGTHIAFASDRAGPSDVYVKGVTGSAPERRIGSSRFVMFPTAWSPDGRVILFQHHKQFANSLDALRVESPEHQWSFAVDGATDASAQFSPNGRWVAHARGRGDRVPTLGAADAPQIIVQDFPAHHGSWQLTTRNGWEPRWRGDGQELYYLEIDAAGAASVMAMRVDGTGNHFRFGAARKLFTVPVWMGPPTPRNHYAVTKDGERFLFDVLLESPEPQPLSVLVDWRALLPLTRAASAQFPALLSVNRRDRTLPQDPAERHSR